MKRPGLNRMLVLLALMVVATAPFAWMSQHLEYQPHKPFLNGIAISPDGRRAYVSESQTGTISVLSIEQGVESARFRIDGVPAGMAFNADGTRAYITSRRSDGKSSVLVIDTARDAAISAFPIPDCAAGQLAVSAGGATVALASANKSEVCTASLDLATGIVSGLTRHLEGELFYHAAFTHDAKEFVLGACRSCDHNGMYYGLSQLSLVAIPVDRTQPPSVSTRHNVGVDNFDISRDGKLLAFQKDAYYGDPIFAVLVDRASDLAIARIPLALKPFIRVQFATDNQTLYAIDASSPPVMLTLDIAKAESTASLTLPPDRKIVQTRTTAKHLLLLNSLDGEPGPDALSGDVTVVDLRTNRVAAVIPVAAPAGLAFKLRVWQVALWIRARNPWAR
jgi:YVTN family beta-propeller protein